MGIQPNTVSARRPELLYFPGAGPEIISGILRIDTAFDRDPLHLDIILGHPQPFTARKTNLLLDQVDSSHHLGNRMLNLDAGIHLDEVEVEVPVDDKLHRAGIGIAGCFHQLLRRNSHLVPNFRRQPRRGRLLDQLLMPALETAITLAKMDHLAMVISEDLDLHMPGLLHVLLEINI